MLTNALIIIQHKQKQAQDECLGCCLCWKILSESGEESRPLITSFSNPTMHESHQTESIILYPLWQANSWQLWSSFDSHNIVTSWDLIIIWVLFFQPMLVQGILYKNIWQSFTILIIGKGPLLTYWLWFTDIICFLFCL